MPTLEHPKVVKIAYNHLHHGQKVVNTLHWYRNADLTQGMINEFGYAADTYYRERVPGMFSYQMTFRGIKLRQRVKNNPLGYDSNILGGVEGEITVQANRPAQALSLKLATASFDKSSSGTWFAGGIPDNTVIAGLYDDNYRTNYATTLNNYLLALKDDFPGWIPVIFSQVHNKQTRANPWLYPITAVQTVTLYPAHMSSRNPGSGE